MRFLRPASMWLMQRATLMSHSGVRKSLSTSSASYIRQRDAQSVKLMFLQVKLHSYAMYVTFLKIVVSFRVRWGEKSRFRRTSCHHRIGCDCSCWHCFHFSEEKVICIVVIFVNEIIWPVFGRRHQTVELTASPGKIWRRWTHRWHILPETKWQSMIKY